MDSIGRRVFGSNGLISSLSQDRNNRIGVENQSLAFSETNKGGKNYYCNNS